MLIIFNLQKNYILENECFVGVTRRPCDVEMGEMAYYQQRCDRLGIRCSLPSVLQSFVDIRWLTHARQRLHERRIRESLVRTTLRDPEQVIEQGRYKIFQRRYTDPRRQKVYLLRVFVETLESSMIVRSVYRTSKVTKYWSRDDSS